MSMKINSATGNINACPPQRLPLFMTRRHIRKTNSKKSVVCVDSQFPELYFYIPKPWGIAWFNKQDLPKTPEGIEIEVGDISVYCSIRMGFDPTLMISLDVGDVLRLRPINLSRKKGDSNMELLVQIDDINFAPSGRKAELIINYV